MESAAGPSALASMAPLTKVDYQGGRSTAVIGQPNLNGAAAKNLKQSFGPQN